LVREEGALRERAYPGGGVDFALEGFHQMAG